MKIVLLLFALLAAFSFACKKTFDSRVLLAERLQTERLLAMEETEETYATVVEPRLVVLL